jgi:hypothetical protein
MSAVFSVNGVALVGMVTSGFMVRPFGHALCLCPNVDLGQGLEEPENVQEPQNYSNYYNAIQDRLDGWLHWNIAIYQPQENTHHD